MVSVSFRPQVTLARPVVKQAEANFCREKLNNVEKAVHNNQISDISAMTQRMQLESKLNDTKVAPIRYIEEVKPQDRSEVTRVADLNAATKPKTVTDVIKNFHNGAKPSKHEQSQVLSNQMNMMAASNMVLHGLF